MQLVQVSPHPTPPLSPLDSGACNNIIICSIGVGTGGAGLTTFLTCYFKAKSRVRQAMSLSHSLLANAIARDRNRYSLSVYCCASSEMSDTVAAIRPNCSSAQHSKVTHSLHKHLTTPILLPTPLCSRLVRYSLG